MGFTILPPPPATEAARKCKVTSTPAHKVKVTSAPGKDSKLIPFRSTKIDEEEDFDESAITEEVPVIFDSLLAAILMVVAMVARVVQNVMHPNIWMFRIVTGLLLMFAVVAEAALPMI